MFNKKLVDILCWIIAVMLVVQLVLNLVMWIWGYFSQPALAPEFVKVYNVIAGIGQVIFIYIIVAAIRSIADGTGKRK
jgi:hypothetical protein